MERYPMEDRYTYFKGTKDKEFHISTMKKYFVEKQEMDKFLEKIIDPFIRAKELKIVDACCGIGHLSYFLSEISPKSTFLGIDQTPYLIDEAKKICVNKKNISFEIGDIYDVLPKYKKTFDICINWKTISWLPYYEHCLRSLILSTRKHIFLSSLFYDGDIDFEIKVREFKKESGKKEFNAFYNVYSFPRFKQFVYQLGAKNIESYDFEINVDVSKPPIDQMGTYTIMLENGKRLQISGTIVMTWKVVRIDL